MEKNSSENSFSVTTSNFETNDAENTKRLNLECNNEGQKAMKDLGFWKGLEADITNIKLLPIKFLYFFKYATLFVLYPFLALHMKYLGLNPSEAGIIQAFIPIIAILGPPFAGILADRIGNFKVFLAAITLINAGMSLLLVLIPIARQEINLPENVTFSFSCSSSSSSSSTPAFAIKQVDDIPCNINLTRLNYLDLPPAPLYCGILCDDEQITKDVVKVSKSNILLDPEFDYASEDFQEDSPPEQRNFTLPNGKVFIPNQRLEIECDGSGGRKCALKFLEYNHLSDSEKYEMLEIHNLAYSNDLQEKGEEIEINVTHPEFEVQGLFSLGAKSVPKGKACSLPNSIMRKNPTCVSQCFTTFKRKLFCNNLREVKVFDVSLTFWLNTLFRILLGLTSSTSYIVFEGAVMAIIKEQGGELGIQKFTGVVAACIASPLSGTLIYKTQDFRPAFYLYAALQALCSLITLKIDLTFKKPSSSILSQLKKVLSNLETVLFFLAVLASGTAWGYVESFLFWFLKDLGGNEVLMGLTVTTSGSFGLPFLVLCGPIVKRLGHVNVISIGLLFYSIRMLGFSYIENPWMCLPYEALEAVTGCLAITAATMYAAALSTQDTIATVQGIMGGLYFGIGRGLGSLIGGFLIKWFGTRESFRIFSASAFIASVLYFIANLTYIKKHTKVGVIAKSGEDEKMEGEDEIKEKVETGGGVIGDSGEVEADKGLLGCRNLPVRRLSVMEGFIGQLPVNIHTDEPLEPNDEKKINKSDEPTTVKKVNERQV